MTFVNFFCNFIFEALKNREDNVRRTRGGEGVAYTDAETHALDALVSRKSDLVDGIAAGFEIGTGQSLPPPADQQKLVTALVVE